MSAVGSLRQRLRIETRKTHDALDQTLELIERPLTLTQYGRLLGRFLGIHLAVEPLLSRNLDPALMEGRSKLSALDHDLQACGFEPNEIQTFPVCDVLPTISNRATALGALYVIEGSTLGGRVIAQSIARNEQIPPHACRYFDIYGAQAGTRWRAVCDALEACDDQAMHIEAVTSAKLVFGSLTLWLDPISWRTDAADGGRDRD